MPKIAVCIKQIPFVEDANFDPVTRTIRRDGVNVISAFDQCELACFAHHGHVHDAAVQARGSASGHADHNADEGGREADLERGPAALQQHAQFVEALVGGAAWISRSSNRTPGHSGLARLGEPRGNRRGCLAQPGLGARQPDFGAGLP